MASNEKFCLRWNDFETNISSAFQEIREEKEFFDVTIATEDSQLEAHRVILSACSPFFRQILNRTHHHHPLLYLKGVRFDDLSAVLNFMYHGEVNVAQEELNSFLAVAEDLKVKGLTQSKTAMPAEPAEPVRALHSNNRVSSVNKSQSVPAKPSYSAEAEEEIQEILPIKSEPSCGGAEQQQCTEYAEEDYADADYAYEEAVEAYGAAEASAVTDDGNKDHKKIIGNMIWERIAKLGGGTYKCVECGLVRNSGGLTALKNHVELKHLANIASYICQYCSKVLNTSNAYHQHLMTHKM